MSRLKIHVLIFHGMNRRGKGGIYKKEAQRKAGGGKRNNSEGGGEREKHGTDLRLFTIHKKRGAVARRRDQKEKEGIVKTS